MPETISERDAASYKQRLHSRAAAKTWHFLNFASVQAALDFVNAPPAQVAGEISATARNDGTVGMFYFL
ncbi:MAG: hypothetical protein JO100_15565 [Pseudonocardia sp.]|nr:hypothetical protein [Pseudonocardia sp.]